MVKIIKDQTDINRFVDEKCQYNPYFPRRNEILTYREFVGRMSEAASYDQRFRQAEKNKMENRKAKTTQQLTRVARELDKRHALALDHMAAYAKKHNIEPTKSFMDRLKSAFTRSGKRKNNVYAC
jgi:di/tripeptidase